MLDNVIDINYYPVAEAQKSNLRHRPVGLGLMGFQDALYKQRLCYGSREAVDFADISMELISYFAIESSCDLAQERGSYSSFEGSLWSQGVLPIDSIQLLGDQRAGDDDQPLLKMDTSQTLDWDSLRDKVRQHGMRNSNVMAIAPTATIANIVGVSQSVEPTYSNLFSKQNLSGDFTGINTYLVRDLKERNLWDTVMVDDLKHFSGRVTNINRVPEDLKKLYQTAMELDQRWIIEAASRRQKWIDQSQSLNIYADNVTKGVYLMGLYEMAWLYGLKTTYYLRSRGATNTEKSTITDKQLNAVPTSDAALCSLDDEACEACQ